MPSRIAIAKSSHFACVSRGSGFFRLGSPAPDPASRKTKSPGQRGVLTGLFTMGASRRSWQPYAPPLMAITCR